jgi:hypothetical protein
MEGDRNKGKSGKGLKVEEGESVKSELKAVLKSRKGGKTKPSEFGFEGKPNTLDRIEFRGIGR